MATSITPGGYPQAAAAADGFAHHPCGHKNGRWPAPMAIVPSFHWPYDYDDSYIYQAVNSKTARPVCTRPVKRHGKTVPLGDRHSVLAARPDAGGRGAVKVSGADPLTIRARTYPGESVMTHTESGGGSK